MSKRVKSLRLKSTDETAVVLGQGDSPGYFTVLLPPQAPGHKCRIQNVHRLSLSGDKDDDA